MKILILPFHIPFHMPTAEYLREGMLEEMICLLSQPSIAVSPRATSLYLASNPIPFPSIAEKYEVDFILEGGIRWRNDAVTLSARLFEARTEKQLHQLTLPFDVESWVAAMDTLAEQVQATLGSGTKPSLDGRTGVSDKARELYQQGLYHWHRYAEPELRKAIACFKKSIAEAPDYALPYTGIADCYSVLGTMGHEDAKRSFEQAYHHVKEALKRDDKRCETYVSAALAHIFGDRDLVKAKANLDQAKRLNAHAVPMLHAHTLYYIHTGDLPMAERYSKMSIEADPLALPYHAMMVRIQLMQRDYDLAMDYLNMAWSIESESYPLMHLQGYLQLLKGNVESALKSFQWCLERNPDDVEMMAFLATAYVKAGFLSEAHELSNRLLALHAQGKSRGMTAYALCILKAAFKDSEAFYNYLEEAIASGVGLISGMILHHPLFDAFRGDARFQKILDDLFVCVRETAAKRKPEQIIQIVTETTEVFSIDPQDIIYIKAEDNYCTVHWRNSSDDVQQKVLRVTLKKLELQFAHIGYLYRCHKSYIVNVDYPFTLSGNPRGYMLNDKSREVSIPVSRAKSGEVKAFF